MNMNIKNNNVIKMKICMDIGRDMDRGMDMGLRIEHRTVKPNLKLASRINFVIIFL
jgi:hypothetical protein